MLSRFALSAALALTGMPALAQPPATAPSGGTAAAQQYQPTPAETAAIQQAAQGFGGCIQSGVGALPATVAADAGAATVIANCASQRQALVAAIEAMIPHMPADQQAAARAQVASRLDTGLQADIAGVIAQQRAAAAAAAVAPTTTPATTPTPH